LIEERRHRFWASARIRYNILLRQRGESSLLPGGRLTWDTVMEKYRFCNVFREDDRTTVWLRENVRSRFAADPRMALWTTLVFRLFNRIETYKLIDTVVARGPGNDMFEANLRFLLGGVAPLVTGAYMVKSPARVNKLNGMLKILHPIRLWCAEPRLLDELACWDTMRIAWERLQRFPFIGAFNGYQFVVDLRHTCVLDHASDVLTWAAPGPGSARGAGWLACEDPARFAYSRAADREEIITQMRELLEDSGNAHYWPDTWPTWEMADVQHWLCEYDKWERGCAGQRLKRRYVPR